MNDKLADLAKVAETVNRIKMKSDPLDNVFPNQYSGGLTKRELFAAMAMQGIVANHVLSAAISQERGGTTAERFTAIAAIELADALLAELAK